MAALLLLVPCHCPDSQLALYEYDNGWQLTEGAGVALVGDARAVSWSSDSLVDSVLVKAGPSCEAHAGGYAGQVLAVDHDLSSIRFCVAAVTLSSFGGGLARAVACGLALWRWQTVAVAEALWLALWLAWVMGGWVRMWMERRERRSR